MLCEGVHVLYKGVYVLCEGVYVRYVRVLCEDVQSTSKCV